MKLSMNLEPILRSEWQKHVEHHAGLIAGADRLLEQTLRSVETWLKRHEQAYTENEQEAEALAIHDLRVNLLRADEENAST